ncbi:hypothetical protein [Alterisphingorhabdus coralli]|uniref:MarR family transcriptional regulator n=1 Tax=Alterisphingorhabdus coralli TaxID=3071408 RepID=A0AA97I2M2_9SPHN|nr:hypothetical protein [Parasphingorhabdus sp. SCSIO 66989]WOE76398.1 hypothetical protein RB602_06705 [Parasphingorhabdus sp. SCSIO 66989]
MAYIDTLSSNDSPLFEQLGRATLFGCLDDIDIASYIRFLRRKRDESFAEGYFSDPCWDILLELYISHASGQELSTSYIGYPAKIPLTTGLRQLDILQSDELIYRRKDSEDARRTIVGLTAKGMSKLRALFESYRVALMHLQQSRVITMLNQPQDERQPENSAL